MSWTSSPSNLNLPSDDEARRRLEAHERKKENTAIELQKQLLALLIRLNKALTKFEQEGK